MQLRRRTRRTDDAFVVTSAQRPRSEDVDDRARKYTIKMTIRAICLVLAVFVPITWLRVIFVIAAVALPWFSVIAANGAPVQGTTYLEPPATRQGRSLPPAGPGDRA